MVQQLIQQVSRWDERAFGRVFGESHSKALKRLFYFLSRSADCTSCALMGLVWGLVKPETAPFLAAGLFAFGLELSAYYLIKKSIRRPRPFRRLRGVHYLIVPPDEFSFPSGHTAAAFLMACLLTTAFPALALPAFTWAVLVGFSRVYLGVHYPGDVLAGMILGAVSAQAGLGLLHLLS